MNKTLDKIKHGTRSFTSKFFNTKQCQANVIIRTMMCYKHSIIGANKDHILKLDFANFTTL